jgi:hypothetical protein
LRKEGLAPDGQATTPARKRGRPAGPKQEEKKDEKPEKSDEGPDVDLVAWYQGTAFYRFDQVAEAIDQKYNLAVMDEANARRVIADEENLGE